MAIRELIKKAQDTVGKAVTDKLSARATQVLDMVEQRAPDVAAKLRPAVDLLRNDGAAAKTRETPRDEKSSSQRAEREGTARKTTSPRTAGRKTVPSATAPKRAAQKAETASNGGFKVKRGQKHHHHR